MQHSEQVSSSCLREGGVLVIGLSGVTCGGKTTIAERLESELQDNNVPCFVIGQDDYYKDEKDIAVDETTGLEKWDTIGAFLMEKFRSDFVSRLNELSRDSNTNGRVKAVLIVEGILIFDDEFINEMFNKRFFMTLSYEETIKRRRSRVYEPPEDPRLFDAHTWPMYIEYRDKHIKSGLEITFVDAELPIDDVFDIVKSNLSETYQILTE